MGLSLEIISHAWRYARLLNYHLSALADAPPLTCRVTATVFYCPADTLTVAMLDYFRALSVPNVAWNFRPLEQPRLCRRAIGRNLAALESTADYVLFSDVDYIFTAGSLDSVAAALAVANAAQPVLCYPREIMVSRAHVDGDAEIQRVQSYSQINLVNRELYIPRIQPRAIGGSMWITGAWGREHGYLPNSRRFQRPARHWVKTTDDVVFRSSSGLQSVPLDIPGVYRIRHSKQGRNHIGVEL